MWINSAACFWIASTTLGWQCPVETTAIPAEKSRNSLPSTSSQITPRPRSDLNQFRGLLLDRLHHFGMAVSSGNHGDSGGEIQEFIAVNVLNNHAAAAFGHQRIGACVRWRNILCVALQDGLGLGAGQLGANLGTCGGNSLRCHVHPLFKKLVAC